MTAPNLFIVYVTDIERATNFYRDLFEIEPVMITPRYVPFEVAPGVIFALSDRGGEQVDPKTPRSFVVGLMVPRREAAVDDVYAAWTAKGVTVAEEPHDEIFGRTFAITDPDGNPICVTPVDLAVLPGGRQAERNAAQRAPGQEQRDAPSSLPASSALTGGCRPDAGRPLSGALYPRLRLFLP